MSASLYYLQWKNIQQFVYLTCGLGFDYNLGKVTGKGGDIEVDVAGDTKSRRSASRRPTPTRSSTTDGDAARAAATSSVASGDHLPASPWNIDGEPEYVLTAIEKKPYLRLDYQYATAQNAA